MRLHHDLEAALVAIVDLAGESPDPALRALAVDALALASAHGLRWVQQATTLHTPDDDGVPFISVEWRSYR